MKKLSLIVTLALLIFSKSMCNDTELGNFGYSLIPMKPSKVQMLKELVYVELFDYKCVVHCKFWFYNHGNSVKLDVGFPDFHFPDNDYENYKPIQNFRSLVNGKKADIKYISKISEIRPSWYADKEHDTIFNNWFVKKVNFPKNDTVVIENYYVGELGGSVTNLLSQVDIFYYYVIGTGSSWYNNISEGKIIFDYTNLYSSDFISSIYSGTGYEEKSKNKKFNINISENLALISFKDYKPLKNEVIGIEFYRGFYINEDVFDFLIGKLPNEEYNDMSKEFLDGAKRELLKNFCDEKLDRISKELIAREGYIFPDSSDNLYFETKPWYKPNPDFIKSENFSDYFDNNNKIQMLKKITEKCKSKEVDKPFDENKIKALKNEFELK